MGAGYRDGKERLLPDCLTICVLLPAHVSSRYFTGLFPDRSRYFTGLFPDITVGKTKDKKQTNKEADYSSWCNPESTPDLNSGRWQQGGFALYCTGSSRQGTPGASVGGDVSGEVSVS